MSLFEKVFKQSPRSSKIIKNEKTGDNFKMFFILASHYSEVFDPKSGSFHVGINQANDFMSLLDNSVKAEVGYHTHIKVVPSQYVTTSGFRDLSEPTRRCKYRHENSNATSLFKFYSQKSCEFECRLRSSSEECGCTPWNFPQDAKEITEICDGVQVFDVDIQIA